MLAPCRADPDQAARPPPGSPRPPAPMPRACPGTPGCPRCPGRTCARRATGAPPTAAGIGAWLRPAADRLHCRDVRLVMHELQLRVGGRGRGGHGHPGLVPQPELVREAHRQFHPHRRHRMARPEVIVGEPLIPSHMHRAGHLSPPPLWPITSLPMRPSRAGQSAAHHRDDLLVSGVFTHGNHVAGHHILDGGSHLGTPSSTLSAMRVARPRPLSSTKAALGLALRARA